MTQPLHICIGPTIRIGRESWCLPYAGFLMVFTVIGLKMLRYTWKPSDTNEFFRLLMHTTAYSCIILHSLEVFRI